MHNYGRLPFTNPDISSDLLAMNSICSLNDGNCLKDSFFFIFWTFCSNIIDNVMKDAWIDLYVKLEHLAFVKIQFQAVFNSNQKTYPTIVEGKYNIFYWTKIFRSSQWNRSLQCLKQCEISYKKQLKKTDQRNTRKELLIPKKRYLYLLFLKPWRSQCRLGQPAPAFQEYQKLFKKKVNFVTIDLPLINPCCSSIIEFCEKGFICEDKTVRVSEIKFWLHVSKRKWKSFLDK